MKLYKILFEQAEDRIEIVGYHRNNNPKFSKSDITMEPRITRQSKGGVGNVGFYITMPKMNVDSVENLPSRIESPMDIGKNYGEHLYEIVISVPREQILLNNNTMGSTRVSSGDLAKMDKKFIYVPRGFPTAEGIVLDPSIVTSVRKITVSWYKPPISEEYEEMERTSEDLGIDLHEIEDGYENGSLIDLTDDIWEKMENTDSWNIRDLQHAKEYAEEYDKDIESIIEGFESGNRLPAPIVLIKSDGVPYLIAGNTRLMVARALKVIPKVVMVRIEK